MAERGESAGGCVLLVIIGIAAWAWFHHKSPEAKAQAEAAAVTDSATPSVIDAAAAKVNLTRGEFDEDRARDAAINSLDGETYESVVGNADCTEECSGHEAGWKWAKDGNDCGGGDSPSFDEGCNAYDSAVEDRVENARRAYEAGDDTFAGVK